jgi:hypothetical protein
MRTPARTEPAKRAGGGAERDDRELEVTRVIGECRLDGRMLSEDPYLEWLVARYRQALCEYAAVPMPLTEHVLDRARADLQRTASARVGS